MTKRSTFPRAAGGAWYYTEHVRPNQGAGSYEKLVTNTSKEMSCFSDFPMPKNYPQVKRLIYKIKIIIVIINFLNEAGEKFWKSEKLFMFRKNEQPV